MEPRSESQNLREIAPHSIEAERAVLGGVLRSPDTLTVVEGKLQAKHFFQDAHRKIFECILELSAKNESASFPN